MGGELRFVYSGTSPLGHLYSRVDSLQGTKNLAPENFPIIFAFVTSIEGTPLFRGWGHFFWVPGPGFDLHQGTP